MPHKRSRTKREERDRSFTEKHLRENVEQLLKGRVIETNAITRTIAELQRRSSSSSTSSSSTSYRSTTNSTSSSNTTDITADNSFHYNNTPSTASVDMRDVEPRATESESRSSHTTHKPRGYQPKLEPIQHLSPELDTRRRHEGRPVAEELKEEERQ